jgi:hypothetical protein
MSLIPINKAVISIDDLGRSVAFEGMLPGMEVKYRTSIVVESPMDTSISMVDDMAAFAQTVYDALKAAGFSTEHIMFSIATKFA